MFKTLKIQKTLNNILQKLSTKKILFNKNKAKINITLLLTKENEYLKIYSFFRKKVIYFYDLKNNKRILEFGITNDLNSKKYIHLNNKKEEILNI